MDLRALIDLVGQQPRAYGIAPLREDSSVSFAALDVDDDGVEHAALVAKKRGVKSASSRPPAGEVIESSSIRPG